MVEKAELKVDKLPPAPTMSPSKPEAKNQGKDGLEAPLSTPRLDGIKKSQAAGLSAKPIESVHSVEDGRGSEKVSLPSIGGGGAPLAPKGAYSLAPTPAPAAPMGEGKNEGSLAPPMPLPEGAEIKGAKGKAGLLPLGETGSKKKKKKKNKKKGTF